MKQALFDKWIEALESGKYKQGRVHLKHDGAYCCLGVLCEVAKAGKNWKERNSLPQSFANKVGMGSLGGPRDDSGAPYLSDLNDGDRTVKRHTFSEIAAILCADPLRYIKSIEP